MTNKSSGSDVDYLFDGSGALGSLPKDEENDIRKILGLAPIPDELIEEEGRAFPAGSYYCMLGKTALTRNSKGDSYANEFFVLNFYGTPEAPKTESRILITGDGIRFWQNKEGLETTHGIKMVEFYSLPGHQFYKKSLEFKKRAFCKPFGAYDDEKRLVQWDKLNELIGTTFRIDVEYANVKGKYYRNLVYLSIQPFFDKKISMKSVIALYKKYDEVRSKEEDEKDNFSVPSEPDIPSFLK